MLITAPSLSTKPVHPERPKRDAFQHEICFLIKKPKSILYKHVYCSSTCNLSFSHYICMFVACCHLRQRYIGFPFNVQFQSGFSNLCATEGACGEAQDHTKSTHIDGGLDLHKDLHNWKTFIELFLCASWTKYMLHQSSFFLRGAMRTSVSVAYFLSTHLLMGQKWFLQ